MTNILLTGGLGFIGSHISIELINSGYNPIIVDNLSNSSFTVLDNIEKICGKKPICYVMNVQDHSLNKVFEENKIDHVIHLAGLKAVSESIKNPLKYYDTNINSTLNLIRCMKDNNCYNLVFSSSATVYGDQPSPLTEASKIGSGITNPYGETKYMIEQILKSLVISDPKWRIVSLRYFNPVGAHDSGILGESPNDIPNNLMPFIMRVACKNNTFMKLDDVYNELKIFGSDYSTQDGTCIRDFIHVVDLAKAHLSAINYLPKIDDNKYKFFNIGTGKGTSVLELVNTFRRVNNLIVPYRIVGRRDGDLPIVYCDNSYAIQELGWKPQKTVQDICKDAWRFQLSSCYEIIEQF
jgi:UDP-glucose 4-epimerase